jgi:hypothetical protein
MRISISLLSLTTMAGLTIARGKNILVPTQGKIILQNKKQKVCDYYSENGG